MSDINLPHQSWSFGSLSNLSYVKSGIGFPIKFQGKLNETYPVYKVGDISKSVLNYGGMLFEAGNYVSETDITHLKGEVFEVGTTLFAKIGEAIKLNRRAFVKKPGLADNNVMAVIPHLEESSKFLYYFLKTIDLSDVSRSTTVPSVRKGDIENIPISIPSLAEQKVIAEKLDDMLAKVERIKVRIECIPQILKKFRQSVLADAVSGKLTEEWRKVSNLPSGGFVKLKDVVEVNPKKERYEDDLDVGFVPMSKINEGTNYDLTFETVKWGEVKTGYTSFKNNDVLLAKITPCFENGKSAITADLPNGIGAGSTEYIVLRSHENKILPSLIAFNISTEAFLSEGALSMTGSVGHKRVPKEFVENWQIYLPHEEEQRMICQLVNQAFNYAKIIETQTINSFKKIELLSSSILAQAFRGELTKQWRKDNIELISGEHSAGALLAKIKTEMKKK